MKVRRIEAPKRPSRWPQQDRSRHKRDEILRAAQRLFSESGYRSTGVAAVAKEVGVSPSHVMYYFATKEQLLTEVVEFDETITNLSVDLSQRPPLDALRSLPEIGRAMDQHDQSTRLLAVLLAENLGDGPLRTYFARRLRRATRLLAEKLREGQRDGTIRTDLDVDEVASEVFAVMEGLRYHHLLDPQRVSIERGLRRYLDRVLPSLAQ